MTRLLVSVRSAVEAADAVAAGADLIDVKEPSAGSLGAATPDMAAAVLDAVAGRRPTSIAMGELFDRPDWRAYSAKLPSDRLPQFVKFGLAGCAGPDLLERWQSALAPLPVGVAPVGVIYADWQIAESPQPEAVLQCAKQLGCRAILIDTFDKRGPGLIGLWNDAELDRCVEAVRAAGLLIVLAGKIAAEQLDQLLPLAPDYIAVRGAVCRDDRQGRLDPERVARFRGRLENAAGFAVSTGSRGRV